MGLLLAKRLGDEPGSLNVPPWAGQPSEDTQHTLGALARSQEAGLLHWPSHSQAVLVHTPYGTQLMARLQQVRTGLCVWGEDPWGLLQPLRGLHGSSGPSPSPALQMHPHLSQADTRHT